MAPRPNSSNNRDTSDGPATNTMAPGPNSSNNRDNYRCHGYPGPMNPTQMVHHYLAHESLFHLRKAQMGLGQARNFMLQLLQIEKDAGRDGDDLAMVCNQLAASHGKLEDMIGSVTEMTEGLVQWSMSAASLAEQANTNGVVAVNGTHVHSAEAAMPETEEASMLNGSEERGPNGALAEEE
ncbi:hypothetical protein Z517_09369 [Fonsecaea pedrosoi CBS 271.37]|uniref:Unplaced genomic scaffold supercont1.6, whole genome shotgun sequence n=1 Tax=Fonsecaea pedrosoi CBS 271.37 TaxID=1442368 RepID=A0A0D2GE56_9EURO|nr:uncharacterized protein Z517_09369 [Fonsecaea pedrosoi CBS 271.37]KIW76925.1 hypothetical protein Z517_09369 [Fonsecaea pedrosoi CBS 271.37]